MLATRPYPATTDDHPAEEPACYSAVKGAQAGSPATSELHHHQGRDPDLRAQGTTPVIPGIRTRKRRIRHDKSRYRERWRIEAAFNRLKDFRRIATRYDKLARNYASAIALAAVIAFWC